MTIDRKSAVRLHGEEYGVVGLRTAQMWQARERIMWQFCFKVGIDSVRNLEIFLKKSGIWDGHEWSHGELAEEYGISRPRSVQICTRTESLLKAYYAKPTASHPKTDFVICLDLGWWVVISAKYKNIKLSACFPCHACGIIFHA